MVFILILYLHSDIEVNDFQAKVAINKEVMRLVSDTEPVKIRETLTRSQR